jgi:hypothetical protein
MSLWTTIRDDIETVVGDAAPIVLSAVGGPAGAAVGDMIAQAVGVDTPSHIHEALMTDPKAAEKIRELEITKGLDIAKLDAKARLRQMQVVEEEVKHGGLIGQWEDVLGWTCSLIFAQAFLAFPLAEAIASWIGKPLTGWPHYQLGAVLTVLGTLIGAGGMKIVKARRS